jgi:hypothetical protein
VNRKGCLIAVGTIAGLLLLCCVVLWFVGIPRLQDQIADSVSEALGTEVAQQLDTQLDVPGGELEAGTYTISVADLQRELDSNVDDSSSTSDFVIAVDSTGIEIGFTSGTQDFGYSGRPVAENGEIRIDDMEVNNSTLGFIMPADKVATMIEDAINGYFSERGLEIESIQLGNDTITVTAVEAGG